MNVYATSDLHGNLPEVPDDADLLLIAGDICPDFRPLGNRNHWDMIDKSGAEQARWLDTEFRAWLERVEAPVVAIWGNHDFVGEKPVLVPDLPWTLLESSEATVGDLRVWGTPWVPGLPYWAFYASEEGLRARAEVIPEGIDVLMTHGPPYGAGDFIPTSVRQATKYGNHDGKHVGDYTLNPHIERVRPKAVVCGHIHEARGGYRMRVGHDVTLYGDSVSPSDIITPPPTVPLYNVAAVDEAYNLHRDPWVRLPL
jgi:Icc-related predicted phosphoesterase